MPTIAIIGASPERSKFGNKAVRAYLARGWHVFPVNPKAAEIEGLPVYRSIADVPAGELDRVSVYLSPALGMQVIEGIAGKQVDEVWFNPGADGPEVLAKARALGLNAIAGCSIVDIGVSPADFPDV